jgi:alkylation response protein AidB-like acyl-CoA dehydrogenase
MAHAGLELVEQRPVDLLAVAEALAQRFAQTAVERDHRGGTPKLERDALRASGLLTLAVPRALGGHGAEWKQIMDIVRCFARVDSSIAHVFGFQHLMLATARLYGRPDQWEPLFEQTVRRHWFWGNALNPLDTRTTSTPHEGWREFTGRKSFCSGSVDSDMLIVSARQEGQDRIVVGAIPTARKGVIVHADWDNMGQRQTDSGSVVLDRVRLEENEIFTEPGPLGSVFSSLRSLLAQMTFCNIFLGVAEGAMQEARRYTRSHARLWGSSLADSVTQDPYVLERYGEFWVALEGARLITDRAATLFDEAWRAENQISKRLRGEVAVAVATAKAATTKVGLEITSRMFEVMGARATTGSLAIDRYWRNLRTQTLHDPVEYKFAELGEWALNERIPTPSFYS